MKKLLFTLATLLLLPSLSQAGNVYQECMDENYMTDAGLTKCANEEANRIMADAQKRVNTMAGHRYFKPWVDEKHNFKDFLNSWTAYRDYYCHLYGFAFTQNKDTYGALQEARCKITMNQQFRKDIESVVKTYQNTLPQY